MSQKYRLYIDESGNHSYNTSSQIKERYLCLVGVIISSDENENALIPKWNQLKSLFSEDPDLPPVFHYTDVISKKPPFNMLRDASFSEVFNESYLVTLRDVDYMLCCVVIDKKTHIEKYGQAAMHPYHYCLNVLLERYVRFLISVNGHGDVMAEARGTKEDRLLHSEFERFYNSGTYFLRADIIQNKITSKKIKLVSKAQQVAGIELADMLATPMKYLALWKYDKVKDLDENFTKTVLKTVYCKIRTKPWTKKTKGFGVKLI